MTKSLLTIILVVFFLNFGGAQTPVLPYYWEQPLTFNPSLAGSSAGENIYISLTQVTHNDQDFNSSESYKLPTILESRIIDNYRQNYYISYTKLKQFENSIRLSYGADFSKHLTQDRLMQPTSFGLFGNIHYTFSKKEKSNSSISIGFKANHILRKPNLNMLQQTYGDIMQVEGYSLSEFAKYVSHPGSKFSVGFNYRFSIKNKSIINIGINGSSLKHEVHRDLQTGGYFNPIFYNRKESYLFTNISAQKIFGNRWTVEAQALIYDYSGAGLGIGFRASKNCCIHLNYLIGSEDFSGAKATAVVTINTLKYNYSLSYSRNQTSRSSYFHEVRRIIHLGVGYHFEKRDNVSLFRMN